MNNFITQYTGYEITYPGWDQSYTALIKAATALDRNMMLQWSSTWQLFLNMIMALQIVVMTAWSRQTDDR